MRGPPGYSTDRRGAAITSLIITADDYGYRPAYDAGILVAARNGLIDAVGAMVVRPGIEPVPLLESGIGIGLHLDLAGTPDSPRAGPAERRAAAASVAEQIDRFGDLFGRLPAYLDGHRHSHARPGLGVVIADAATEHGLPVRSVDRRHRRLLRCRGIATPDLLVGRLRESDPALPAELTGAGERLPLPAVVEWMVHPGEPDPASGSTYDAGRAEDLALLRRFRPPDGVVRATHRAVFSEAR